MAVSVHPTAVVDPGAALADGVVIGPYCVVGPHVVLEANVRLRGHVVVDGHTTIGPDCDVYPFASIGLPPQDLKYRGEPSRLVIGRGNVIREHVTMNPGTATGHMLTRIGDDGLFMVGVHVAHDCEIGNHVVMANNATLGGHVTIGDYAILGGLVAVHQFVRVGAHAMIGGMTGVEQDVIPFGLVFGDRGRLAGLNLVGLKRRGFDRDAILALRGAFDTIFLGSDGAMAQRIEQAAATYAGVPEVMRLVEFVRADSDRKVLKPKSAPVAED